MQTDKLELLHKKLKANQVKGLGEYEDFKSNLSDPEKQTQLYEKLKGAGYKGLGNDFSSFKGAFFPEVQEPEEIGGFQNFTNNTLKSFARTFTQSLAYNYAGLADRGQAMKDGTKESSVFEVLLKNTPGPAKAVVEGFDAAAFITAGLQRYLTKKVKGEDVEVSEQKPEERLFMQMGDRVGKAIDNALPTDPKMQESFWLSIVPQGIGSFGAFALAGAASGGVGSLALGSASMGGEEYANAVKSGATPEQAFETQMYNWLIGTTEGIPTNRIIGRAGALTNQGMMNVANRMGVAGVANVANKLTGNKAVKLLTDGFQGGLEELMQETLQSSLTNLVAQKKYDEAREVFDGVMDAAGAGGVIGFAGGLLISSLKKSKARIKSGQDVVTDPDAIAGIQALEDYANGDETALNELIQNDNAKAQEIEQTDDEALVETVVKDIVPVPLIAAEQTTQEQPSIQVQPIEVGPELEAELEAELNEQENPQGQQSEKVEQEPTTEKAFTNVEGKQYEVDNSTLRVPITDVQTDESRFQNREKLNEETVQKIVDNFNETELDPLIIWKDPKDGVSYLLAGHHRLEALKRLGIETVPVKFMQESEQGAIDYATKRSNSNRTLELPSARAKIYRAQREKGTSKEQIRKDAIQTEGKGAAARIIDLSYLSKRGKTLGNLVEFEETADGNNKDLALSIAQRIGRVRQMYPQLTDSHENQLFDFLMKPENNENFKTLGLFSEFVGGKVNFGFEQDKPLPLERRRSEMQRKYDMRLSEANKVVKDLRTEREEKLKKLNTVQKRQQDPSSPAVFGEVEVTNDYIQKAKKDFDEQIRQAQAEVIKLEKERGVFESNAGMDLFAQTEAAQAALEKAGLSKQQTQTIKQANEDRIKSAESSLQSTIDPGRSEQQQTTETSGEQSTSDTNQPAVKEYGADNKLIDRQEYERNKQAFNRDLNKISGGLPIDPVQLVRLVKMATFHVEANVRTFAEFSEKMINEAGDSVRPYLKLLYTKLRQANNPQEFDDDQTVDDYIFQMQQDSDFAVIDDIESIANNDSGRTIAQLLEDDVITQDDVNNATEITEQVKPNDVRVRSEEQAQERADKGMLSEHQTYKNMSEALLPDEKVRQQFEKDLRNLYRVQPQEFTLAAAKEFLAKVGLQNAIATVRNPEQQLSESVRTTLAQQAILGLQEKIDQTTDEKEKSQLYNELADFVDDVVKIFGEQGRALNAIKIFSKLSPRAFVISFKRSMQKKAERVLPLLQEDIRGEVKELGQVSKDVVSEKEDVIRDLMDQIADMQGAIREANTQISGLIEANTQLETDLATQQANKDSLLDQIDTLQEQLKELEGKPSGNGQEAIQEQIDKKKQQLGQLDDVINKIYFEINSLQSQLKKAQKKLSESEFEPNRDNKKDAGGIWQRYRVAIAKSIVRQLGGSSSESAPLQLFTNALMQEIKSKLPAVERAKNNRPAIDAVLDVLRNPERYAEVLDTVYDAVDTDSSISDDMKEQVLSLIDGFNNREVSTKLIRKAMGEAMTDLDMKMAELISDHYGVDTNNRMALLKKLVEQGGLTTQEAEIMAERVDATIKEEIVNTKKKRIKAFLSRMDEKAKGQKESRVSRTNRFVNDLMDLSRLGALGQADLSDAVARFLEIAPDPDALRKIDELAKQADQMIDSSAKDQKMLELMSFIAQQKGISWLDIGTAVSYANMLSSHETQAVNFGSTFVNVLLNAFHLMAMNPFSKEAMKVPVGLIRGYTKSFNEARKVFKTGVVTGTRLRKIDQMGGDTLELIASEKSLARRSLSIMRFVLRTMKASDMLHFKAAEEMRFYYTATKKVKAEGLRGEPAQKRFAELIGEPFIEQAQIDAYNAGLKPGSLDYKHFVNDQIERLRDRQLQEDATNFGETTTFNQTPEGVLGAIALSINQGFNLIDKKTGGRFASTFIRLKVIPFTTVVANVLNEQINYIPVVGMWRYMTAKKDADRRNQNEVLDDAHKLILAKNITSMAATALLSMIVFNDDPEDDEPNFRLHGRGPTDYNKAKQLEQTGWKEYSVQLGKNYYSYKDTPMGLMLAIMGNYIDATRYNELGEEDIATRLYYAMRLVPQTMLNMSFLSGAADFVEKISREGAPKPSFTKDVLGTPTKLAIPNLYRAVNRVFDPKVYTKDNVMELIAATTPAAIDMENKYPVLNRLGEPIRQDWTMKQGLTARFYSEQREHPVFSFLTKRKLFIPTPNPGATTYIDLIGQSRVMNENQYYNFIYYSGTEIRRQMVINKPLMVTMDNKSIDKAMRNIVRVANENAKERVALGGVNQPKVKID